MKGAFLDPNEMREDDVVAELRIRVRRNGSMSVAGDIHDQAYALAMCDAARDAINNRHDRQKLQAGGLLIPQRETPLAS